MGNINEVVATTKRPRDGESVARKHRRDEMNMYRLLNFEGFVPLPKSIKAREIKSQPVAMKINAKRV